ncbi:doublesex- and mab-3-related transcription factor 1 [Galendromus occidentalis]|uniref:Doublesex- and mab-3-related transcription factor 1 n=1 Tax=Galendromus occidentalis TaxID=34638 RepID=A0AAJ6VVU9_9ACAR|nr:doublesex- and mab-3-related transcription factor 1 [Galendromus occidentalis]
MWPALFPGAPSNYLYEVQRMELFRAMSQQHQRQLPAYPMPSIQYPDYMARMPPEIPLASQLDELARSCNVSIAETPYTPYNMQPECSSTTHDATLTSAAAAAAAAAAAKLLDAEEQAVMSRKPNCARCRNHDFKVAVKGHKKSCPFKDCECEKCILIKERQVLMKNNSASSRKKLSPTLPFPYVLHLLKSLRRFRGHPAPTPPKDPIVAAAAVDRHPYRNINSDEHHQRALRPMKGLRNSQQPPPLDSLPPPPPPPPPPLPLLPTDRLLHELANTQHRQTGKQSAPMAVAMNLLFSEYMDAIKHKIDGLTITRKEAVIMGL